jgi:hypothetical protein
MTVQGGGKPTISRRVRLSFGENQRSGGSLPSLKPGEILGAVALAECFTGCWGNVFGARRLARIFVR